MPLDRSTCPRHLRLGLALCVACALPAWGQAPPEPLAEGWRWVRFGANSGLARHRVTAIAETPDGLVWAVAGNRLAQFDGFSWRPQDDVGLPEHVTFICVAGGRLYVLGAGRLFVENAGRFEPVPGLDALGLGLTQLAPADAERVIVLGGNHRLAFLRDGQVEDLPGPPSAPLGLHDAGHGALVSTDEGLYSWREGRWRLVVGSRQGPPGVLAASIAEDGEGIASVEHPAELRGTWRWSAGQPAQRDPSAPQARAVAVDAGPRGHAVVFLNNGQAWWRSGERWRPVVSGDLSPELTEVITTSFRKNGDLWVATESGLWLYRASSRRWNVHAWRRGDERNQVNALFRARDGRLLAGTAEGAAALTPAGELQFLGAPGPSGRAVVTGIAEDDAGRIWIGSGFAFQGVYVLEGGRWTRHETGTDLDRIHVHRLHVDRRGVLWFLTLGPKAPREVPERQPGVHASVFRLEGGHVAPWPPASEIAGHRVYDMTETADGALWFATNFGVCRWRDGQWRRWTSSDGLIGRRVFTIEAAPDGRVYFGDQHAGLGVVDGDRLRYLTTADGLVSDAVEDLAASRYGGLWIATRGGLARYRDGAFTAMNRATGLPGSRLWPVMAEQGRVIVGTANAGIAVLSLDEADRPPQLAIEPVHADERDALVRWSAKAHWGEVPPDSILTRYRVDGGAWSPWGTLREVALDGLRPGPHRLDVRAANPLGRTDAEASAQFDVPLPFYLRAAFLVPLAALLAAVAGLAAMLVVKAGRHRESERALEAQLQHAHKMESIGRLAGSVAHDFNNLLTVISGNAELLGAEVPHGQPQPAELQQIRTAADQASRLTRQLLAFARRQPALPEVLDIDEVVTGTLEMLSRLIGEDVEVRTRLRSERGLVRVDRGQLQSVILNLAVNARDAMPTGGVLTIATSDEQVSEQEASNHGRTAGGPYVTVAVIDTGHGIDEHTRAHLFEPYFTTKDHGKGTGLGLATCYGIARQAGGFIRVSSEVGQGSEFVVYLPRALPDDAPRERVAAGARQPASGSRVLVIEDQAPVRRLACRALQRAGYQVLEAASGPDALAMFPIGATPPAFVLTDVVMPQMSGLEVAQRLRLRFPGIKILFMSGYPDLGGVEGAQELEALGPLLFKPFSPKVLLDHVRELAEEPPVDSRDVG
jgi:signal transduction histidine kinase/CheY-like chemotaxis protein